MIPIRDVNPSRLTPIINYLLIGACVLIFLYEVSLGSRALKNFISLYGLVPAHLWGFNGLSHFNCAKSVYPFFTCMFLHGGWLHLIGNMWVLFIFGDNIESALGHARYLLFYVASGLAAGAIEVVTNVHSLVPIIGASGAIAGVMGAYFILYPKAKILTLFPIFFFFYLLEIPAYVFLGFWFVIQFFNGTFSILNSGQHFAGIAWWAHVGGFIGGIIFLSQFGRSRQL